MRKRIGSFLSKAIPFRAKGYGFFDLVRYTSHRLDILYLGKDYAHPLDILHIVYFHLHLSFKHSVFRLNQQADDIDIEVIGYRAGDRVQHANRVDTLNLERRLERGMMAAPFRIQDAFAKAAFQAHGDRTGTFVDYHVAVIIDKAQRLVAGNRFTAIGNDVIAFESFLLQDIRLLLVIFRFFFRLFLFLFLPGSRFRCYPERLFDVLKENVFSFSNLWIFSGRITSPFSTA